MSQNRGAGQQMIDSDELVSALDQLQQAWADHVAWLRRWHRALLYMRDWEPADLRENAHELCQLGRWYGAVSSSVLRDRAEFVELGESHRLMHDAARVVGLRAKESGLVSEPDFERFMDRGVDMSEDMRRLQNRLLSQLANTDWLTGLRSRRSSDDAIRAECARQERSGEPASVVVVDLDRFKALNDTHGHHAGDAALRQAAGVLANSIRPYDQVFRAGETSS